MFTKVVSGGQTGVDRAALDVALEKSLPCGGWCPQGRRAEDCLLPSHYPLTETPSADYEQRTKWNVRDSDGTLALTRGTLTEGTAYTIETAKELGKPSLVLNLNENPPASAVTHWAEKHGVRVLNVAGPRESKCPGIYEQASEFLRSVF